MTKLIALDNGHGLKTAGKRTPLFTDGTKSPYTGKNFMHEWEFNRQVVIYLDNELKRCGFKTVQVAPTENDVSITARCNVANNAKADLLVSIHANAFQGVWGSASGIETLTSKNKDSLFIGQHIQRAIVAETKLRDRGMKDGAWLGIVKQSKMPTVLVEGPFMDNLNEAKLLLSDAFRKTFAIAVAKGICAAYNVQYIPFKPATVQPTTVSKPTISQPSPITVNLTTYTVKSGDTLSKIAQLTKVSLENIILWNKISNPNNISVGQILRLSSPVEPVTHTVKTNETLWGIAQQYKVTVDQIVTLNNIRSHIIQPGQKLIIKK